MRLLAGAVGLVVSAVALAGAPGSLSGAWLFGAEGPEPKASVVSIPERCWNGGVDFTLNDNGKRLTGTGRWTEPTGGVPRPARDETETLTGTREGDHVLLTGRHKIVAYGEAFPSLLNGEQQNAETTVKYDLRLDAKTGHLVGTRDGRPFWLARFRTHRANCGSPPP
jgi:hypothetical protein